MKQFKAALLTALAHLSKLIVNLFIIKLIALSSGPDGLGFLGNFMSLTALAGTLAGGGIIAGIIKYTAEYSDSLDRQLSFAGSALVYTVGTALVTLLLGILFCSTITQYIFLDQNYKIYIYFFIISQLFISFNNFVYGLINGRKQNSIYALLVITGNFLASVIAFYAIKYYGFWGAIVAIMAPALCSTIPVLCYALHQRFLRYLKFDSIRTDVKLLSKYSLMLFFSAACFPVVEMTIRNNIVVLAGLDVAGYWQAITKLSTAYLSFYSLFLSFYFVPIISSEQNNGKIFIEVRKMIYFIGSLFICMMVLFFCLRNMIIQLVFSKEFLVISNLCLLQMIADFFRVISWVIGFIAVAKAMTKLYIIGELIQGFLFISLSFLALQHYSAGLYGVVVSYMGTSILYCLLVLLYFYYLFFVKENKMAIVKGV